jgi:hypothetical protein
MLVTSQWYLRSQRLSFPCLACIPMDGFKRRRYVKLKIKSCSRVALESFAFQVHQPFDDFVLLELVASRQ